jgi:sensor histidine kinase YesM
MGELKYKKAFRIMTVLLISVSTIVFNFTVFGKTYFLNLNIFVGASVITLLSSFLLSRIQLFLNLRLRKKFPNYDQSFKRRMTWAIIMIPFTPIFVTLTFYLFYEIKLSGYQPQLSNLKWSLLYGFISDIFGFSFGEGIYTFNKWKENIQESEQLKKANLQTQFEGLKNQVNPHFLFNSINTLSSLIHEDKERAEQFIDEMCKVYRYLLRNNEDELVPLTTELKFINSYYHLLKTRYGDGIEMKLNINPETEHYLLPPLTLQLLVENAVKHNNVLKYNPLTIEIYTDEDNWLTIKNNLQKKTIFVDSSKIGLNNIKEKFQLLNQPEIQIIEKPTEFIVKLPLIEKLVKA